MLDLLAPSGLIALAALLLPILIHLVRRSERKLVDFAAMRWLIERSRPRQKIRLHELVLLALRLLLLVLLAFLLSCLVWRESDAPGLRWIMVVPDVDTAAARAAVPDSSNAEWHWLAPGFPELSEPSPQPGVATASLLREVDARLPSRTALSVVLPDELSGLDAARLRLIHAVDWHVLPGGTGTTSNAGAPQALKISVRHDQAGLAELPVVRALVQAWSVSGLESTVDVAGVTIPLPDDAQLVFWLAGTPNEAFAQWVAQGGTGIVTRNPDTVGMPVLAATDLNAEPAAHWHASGRGHELVFARALTPDALPIVGEADFPERLRQLVVPEPAAPDRAHAQSFKPGLSAAMQRAPAKPLDAWLALIVALLFLAERWLATGSRRGAE